MTLVAGWLDHGDVFLVGDTALTHGGPAASPTTTFGELQSLDGRTVEEITPKIVRLAKDFAVGFSGSVPQAEKLFNLLLDDMRRGTTPIAALERSRPFFDEIGAPPLDALIAFVDGGVARMVRFSTTGGLDLNPGPICIVGSAPLPLEAEVRRRLSDLRELDGPHVHERLVAALAKVQSLSVSMPLTQFGIGGVFLGLVVSSAFGSQWQEPITYVVFAPPVLEGGRFAARGPLVSLIHCFVMEEAGVVFSSSLPNTLRVLDSPWTPGRATREHMSMLKRRYPSGTVPLPDDDTEYFVFIDRLGAGATVVKRPARSGFPLRIENTNLLLGSQLVDRLRAPRGEEFECVILVPSEELPRIAPTPEPTD